jgi:hypothetical protein
VRVAVQFLAFGQEPAALDHLAKGIGNKPWPPNANSTSPSGLSAILARPTLVNWGAILPMAGRPAPAHQALAGALATGAERPADSPRQGTAARKIRQIGHVGGRDITRFSG